MPNEWSFRIEILKATQRWPVLVLFCVVGSLAGWAISAVWPTPYRITRELFVGLNVYRAIDDRSVAEYTGAQVVNANDYKNWQMASLNTLIYMDSVISETLQDLREMDPYWNLVTSTELAQSLHVYWRNAGKWRLVAENSDPRLATQAVTVWQDVVVKHVHEAVLASQEAMVWDLQLRAMEGNRAQYITRAVAIQKFHDYLVSWQNRIDPRLLSSELTFSEHWRMWRQLNQTDQGKDWQPLLDSFPSIGEPVQKYADWIETSLPVLDQQVQTLQEQAKELDAQSRLTATKFSEASRKSLGLSATLDVDKISNARAEEMVTRPTGLMMLIGSLVGLFAWMFAWISSISMRVRA